MDFQSQFTFDVWLLLLLGVAGLVGINFYMWWYLVKKFNLEDIEWLKIKR